MDYMEDMGMMATSSNTNSGTMGTMGMSSATMGMSSVTMGITDTMGLMGTMAMKITTNSPRHSTIITNTGMNMDMAITDSGQLLGKSRVNYFNTNINTERPVAMFLYFSL